MRNDSRLLILHPDDNIAVICQPIKAGEVYQLDGATLTMPATIGLGHKIARRAIAMDEPILKYGVSIGFATAPIAPGAHVHIHNMRSGYTPTVSLEAARAAHEGGK